MGTLSDENAMRVGIDPSGLHGGGEGGGLEGSIADQQVAFGNGTAITGSDFLKWVSPGALAFSRQGNPATDGDLRFPNLFFLTVRNTDDSGNVNVLSFAGRVLSLGDAFNERPNIQFQDNGEIDIVSDVTAGDVNINSPAGNAYLQANAGDIYLYALTGAVEIHDVLKLTPIAEPPASPEEGMVYADTDHHLYYYNGTTWKQLDN